MEIFRSITQSLHIEWTVVIAQALSFLVLVVALVRFLYRPIGDMLRQRQEKIANDLAAAEAQQTRAESLRLDYEQRLSSIAEQARARLDQALKDAEASRQRLLASARTEIRDLHQRHQDQLLAEREQLRRDLRTEMADIAVLAAAKALRNRLDQAAQAAVIDQVILDIDALPSDSQTPMESG